MIKRPGAFYHCQCAPGPRYSVRPTRFFVCDVIRETNENTLNGWGLKRHAKCYGALLSEPWCGAAG